jgi:hypothetical protein
VNPEEVRALVEAGTLATPCQIVTRSGDVYEITDRRNIWITEAYPDTLIIAARGRGLSLVGLATVEAIHLEREPAWAGVRP